MLAASRALMSLSTMAQRELRPTIMQQRKFIRVRSDARRLSRGYVVHQPI